VKNLNQRPAYCVETIDLVHKFSEHETALNRVNLQVSESTIYGFLGPNGAGKTTTLKDCSKNNTAKFWSSESLWKKIA
jgi:ABC-type multidrug transport system ATPase subunit